MPIQIDPNKLKDVAQTAVSGFQKSEAAFRSQERAKQKIIRESAKKYAKKIIASIPSELEKIARDLKKVPPDRKIVARILIVHERLYSSMVSRGSLDSQDVIVLKTVKKMLKTLSISGVDKITIEEKTERRGYTDGDGDTTYGPCKHYYLVVEVTLPE